MSKLILIVDDEDTNVAIAENILSSKYKVISVSNSEEAFQKLKKIKPDLILLDIFMVGTDGFEIMKKLNNHDEYNKIPVIFLTADSNMQSEKRGFELGAMDFIRKPFVPQVMLKRIERTIEIYELKNCLEKQVEEKTEQIKDMTLQSISTIVSAVEAKDCYTKGHSVRVAEYAVNIAKSLGFNEERITRLYNIAVLHDIGKIGVPDTILNKPMSLTNEEYSVIKSHTTIGANILANMNFFDGIDIGAKYHHERIDGKGYPNGLMGQDIPLEGRIIAVADAYDAMTSNRSHRNAFPLEKVIEELKNGRGKQFDEHLTDKMLELIDNDALYKENFTRKKDNNDIHELLEGLGEYDGIGPYRVEYSIFKTIYRYLARYCEQKDMGAMIATIILNGIDDECIDIEESMAALDTAIKHSIRRGDVVTKYNKNEQLVILMDVDLNIAQIILNRVVADYSKIRPSNKFDIHYSINKINRIIEG